MYTWNNNYINELIEELKAQEKTKIIKEDIQTLKNLKRRFPNILIEKQEIKDNIKNRNKEYKEIRHHNNIINPSIKKYKNETYYDINFQKINTIKKEILLFTRDNIKNINKKWGETIEPWIFKEYQIDFRKNNEDFIIIINYFKEYFISLSHNNNISDFITPTHEYLHILWYLINHKTADSIECEFLSILGELITTHEMKNNNVHKTEVLKYEIDNINRLLEFLIDLPLKQNIAKSKNTKYTKEIIKKYDDLYLTSISYDYTTVISYLLAFELFDLYIKDKEKCIYLTEKIINSNDKLNKKLKDNNIELLKNDSKYIKQLKKEYVTINNL